MRWCGKFLTCGTASLTFGSVGCDGPTVERNSKAAAQALVEYHSEDVLRKHGSLILASIVGASAPGGGPSALNALSTDAGWRAFYAREIGRAKLTQRFPYPLDYRRPGDAAGFWPPVMPAEPNAAPDAGRP